MWLAMSALTVLVPAVGGDAAAAGGEVATTISSAQPSTADEVTVTPGVEFARSGTTVLTLDVYRPDDRRSNHPAVVLIHGGGWFQGRSGDMAREGLLLARQGWVAFSINYRLAGPGRAAWPGDLDDVRAALWWVGTNAAAYGVDPDKLAVVGASAGGHLATMIATTGIGAGPPAGVTLTAPPSGGASGEAAGPVPPPAKAPRVRVAAAWSPPVDLAALAPAGDQPPPGCGSNPACQAFWGADYWGIGVVPLALGCQPEECPDTYHAASPTEHVGRDTIPLWVVNSTDEIVPLAQVDAFAAELSRAGVPNVEKVLPGTAHPYDYTDRVWNDMVPFLAIYLGVPVPPAIDFTGTRPAAGSDFGWLLLGGVALGILLLLITLAIKSRWGEP